MISYLKGKIKVKDKESLILENQGFGFKVFVSDKTLTLVQEEQEIELYTGFVVRNEKPELYGFLSPQELSVFEIVEAISGIGPKGALLISSLGSLKDLKKAVEDRNFSYFSKVKGIGKKKVQKIVLELGGSLKDLGKENIQKEDEALKALISLGFSRREAEQALQSIPKELSRTKERVQAALQFFNKDG